MSKRTRTPKPKPDNAEVTALRATFAEADAACMHAFNNAIEAAKKTGTIRQAIVAAQDRVEALVRRANDTQYAQDADDAHDASVRLSNLLTSKDKAFEKSLALTELYQSTAKAMQSALLALNAAIARSA